MLKVKVSVILFYDNKNIILQNRKDISKIGEEYGFFGGHSESNEAPLETLKREIKEELNINIEDLKNFQFFKNYKMHIPSINIELERNVFTARIPNIRDLDVKEGKIIITTFEKAFGFKMVPGDVELLKEISKAL